LFLAYASFSGRKALAVDDEPRQIIRDALARALFDADQRVFDALGATAFSGGLRRSQGAAELAGRMVSELTHAGYYLASSRDCPPGASDMQRRMTLEDHIRFGIEMTARPWREMIGSNDRAAAGSARAGMADSITEALRLMRVTLRRRRGLPRD
jgi:hypothetical protein